jgi:excisionase family DNA binding protein
VGIPTLTAGAQVRALYSPKETETLLSVSHAQLYRLIGAGRLDARKIGSRTLITAESIETFLASLPKIGPESTP